MKRLLVLLLVLLAMALAFAWVGRMRARLLVTPREVTLPADGELHRVVEARLSRGGQIEPGEVTVEGAPASVLSEGDGAVSVEIRAPVNPGKLRLTLRYRGARTAVVVHLADDTDDRFGDGTPDFLRLHTAADQAAFRTWFTTLADRAATLSPQRMPVEIVDCAALLRWCYRNTLHAHDVAWLEIMPLDTMPPLPSVAQYVYPLTPAGTNLFRVRSGAYTYGDATNGSFAQFADAQTLWQRNTFFVTRDVRAARPGDLLFYRQLEQNSPYHSMILTGAAHDWAVYDTGPTGLWPNQTQGEVRRVALDDLMHHPDARWRPVPENSNFLGVFRWNILREDLR